MMDDLAAWLRQQLDEDERAAAAVADIGLDTLMPAAIIDQPCATVYFAPEVYARVCSVLGPARVLLEVEAKRRILDELEKLPHYAWEGRDEYGCPMVLDRETWQHVYGSAAQECGCGRDAHVGLTLRLLALPYVDRPGYREEWAP